MTARPNPRNGRYRLISANWKMNLNHLEAIGAMQKLFYSLRPADYNFAEISIHPPFTDLRSLQLLFDSDRMPFALGAQNCHQDNSGAFTGEVSALMLAKLNVKYVIVGHSERRDLFCETDDVIRAKIEAVFSSSMLPILCVGESFAERERGATESVISEQVRSAVASQSAERAARIVVAYEPKWAIGSGTAATTSDAVAGAQIIRRAVAALHGEATAKAVRVQYGGSVNSANAKELLGEPDIDGLLVGGASLDPESFARVIQA